VLSLERTVILLKARVECNMQLALLVSDEALGWDVDVSEVVEAINIPNISLQHFILRKLSQDTFGLPIVVSWLNH